MRYLVQRVGPGQAMGVGCVVGVVLALLPVSVLLAVALIIQSGESEALRLLGSFGNTIAPGQKVAWNAVGLSVLVLLVAFGFIWAVGLWLVALGFNLVAHMTGGLALDVTPETGLLPILPASSSPYPVPVSKDPTMPLPRPLPGPVPAAVFPSMGSSTGPAAGAASPTSESPAGASGAGAPPSGSPASDQSAGQAPLIVQPRLVSDADASQVWVVSKLTTTIGSDPSSDVVLAGDPDVAPRHAEVRIESSGYVLYDLGTPGGTYVNDRRLQGRNLLKDGFRIKFGSTGLMFRSSP